MSKMVNNSNLSEIDTKFYCDAFVELINYTLKYFNNNPSDFRNVFRHLSCEYTLFMKIIKGGSNLRIPPRDIVDYFNEHTSNNHIITLDHFLILIDKILDVL